MKVLVFGGSGKMGGAVAWDLAKADDVTQIGLVGRRLETLQKVKDWVNSSKISMHKLDIANTDEATKLMQKFDVGVICLPDRRTSYKVAETAVKAGLDIADMLEEYHYRPDPYEREGLEIPEGMSLNEYGDWLHETAIANEVTFLDGIGFAPGISNITVGEGIRKLDHARTAVARVGGIPSKESAQRHPLDYMITWSFDHVLREYMINVNIMKDGEIVEVEALSDLERFKFGDEALECAITPGMPSFLFTRPELEDFAEKTIRWPGHYQAIETLKEIGMLDLDPVSIGAETIAPRDFLLKVIEPKLLPLEDDTDVCVMWNSVIGEKDGRQTRIDYYMWDEADIDNGISSMGRVTGFSAAVGALFIGRGLISQKGIVAPEDGITGELYQAFIQEMEERDIKIQELIRTID
jgi:saccharopine dehydrogenase-like NADP-dependent oxidoreductase